MGLAAAEGSSRARGGRGGGDAGGQHQAGGSEPVDSSLLQGLLEETGEESSAAIMEETPQLHLSNSEIRSAGTDTDEVDDSPIEEVRLTVPITDDPTLPALTFRTWFLGLISCALLAFCNQFFSYRQNPLYISSLSVQIVVLPLGRLMAACLPTKVLGFKGTRWSFSLNPGPFNLRPRSVTEFLQVFGPVLECFFGARSKHPKTPQNTFGLFGRPVLACLGPTKHGETRRAGVELKRFTPLAFSGGWRRGRREGDAATRQEDDAAPTLLPPPAGSSCRRPSSSTLIPLKVLPPPT